MTTRTVRPRVKGTSWFARDWRLYVMLILPVAFYLLFCYKPMIGLIIAFQKYNMFKGMWGSKWVGLDNFKFVMSMPDFPVALKNTLWLNFLGLVAGFPVPIILAIMLNELKCVPFKKVSQTLLYLPHFLSWIIIGGMVLQIFSPKTGIINATLLKWGWIDKSIPFLTDGPHWQATYTFIGVWQSMGWGTILYLSAITGINMELFEAAKIDGANKLQQIRHATWAGEGGGVLLNQCPHQLDLLIWLCGMPGAVTAKCHEGKWHTIEVEDDVTAYLEFPGGATGVFVTSTGDLPGTNRLEIDCERGKAVCEDGRVRICELTKNEREICFTSNDPWYSGETRDYFLETDRENTQHAGVINAFAAHLLRGEPLIAEAEDGLRALELSNAIHLSGWTGETLRIPVSKERFDRELDKRIAGSRNTKTGDITYATDHSGTGKRLSGSGHTS